MAKYKYKKKDKLPEYATGFDWGSAVQSGLQGAIAGNTLLPGVGAVAGLATGLFSGFSAGKQQKELEKKKAEEQQLASKKLQEQQFADMASKTIDKNIYNMFAKYGGVKMYQDGGQIDPNMMQSPTPNAEVEGGETLNVPDGAIPAVTGGGALNPISSNAYEIQGNSHANGGVDMNLPEGSQIFSKTLKDPDSKKTFADLAKPILKDIDKQKEALSDKNSTFLQKATAQKNLNNDQGKLDELLEMQKMLANDKYAAARARLDQKYGQAPQSYSPDQQEQPAIPQEPQMIQPQPQINEEVEQNPPQEADMNTVADEQGNPLFKYGGIHIKPSKKGTFTAAAKRHGKGVQGFASQVLAHKENYSTAMVKKANFARNASKWKHEYGGVQYANGGVFDGIDDNEILGRDYINAKGTGIGDAYDIDYVDSGVFYHPKYAYGKSDMTRTYSHLPYYAVGGTKYSSPFAYTSSFSSDYQPNINTMNTPIVYDERTSGLPIESAPTISGTKVDIGTSPSMPLINYKVPTQSTTASQNKKVDTDKFTSRLNSLGAYGYPMLTEFAANKEISVPSQMYSYTPTGTPYLVSPKQQINELRSMIGSTKDPVKRAQLTSKLSDMMSKAYEESNRTNTQQMNEYNRQLAEARARDNASNIASYQKWYDTTTANEAMAETMRDKARARFAETLNQERSLNKENIANLITAGYLPKDPTLLKYLQSQITTKG